jgi:hypothetical protein
MPRLNQERQKELEPERIDYAIRVVENTGCRVHYRSGTEIRFMFNKHEVRLFPYSGWHSGKSIVDGRGIDKLLKQIK